MVPGSTLRYGSSFCRVTEKPRASSRRPIDAAASPLPSDETTPPVMKMYLVGTLLSSSGADAQRPFHRVQILRPVHSQVVPAGREDADRASVLQRPKLFEPFQPF